MRPYTLTLFLGEAKEASLSSWSRWDSPGLGEEVELCLRLILGGTGWGNLCFGVEELRVRLWLGATGRKRGFEGWAGRFWGGRRDGGLVLRRKEGDWGFGVLVLVRME